MSRVGSLVVLVSVYTHISLANIIFNSKDASCDHEACLNVELLQRGISLQRGGGGSVSLHGLTSSPKMEVPSYEHPSWLSSCTAIYLDVGSNIGVQVRKLYEPEKYPDAYILPLFEKHFGSPEQRRVPGNTSGICALGIEPNPEQIPRLAALEEAYNANGWHVHFYLFAAWKEESSIEFNITEDPSKVDWGATISYLELQTAKSKWRIEEVRSVNFSDFVGSLPNGSAKLMKMDIEGAEYETIAGMLQGHRLCADSIKEAFIEAHDEGSTDLWNDSKGYDTIQSRVQNQPECIEGPTMLSEVDDETYMFDMDDNYGIGPFEPNMTELQILRESEDLALFMIVLPVEQMTAKQVFKLREYCFIQGKLSNKTLPYACSRLGYSSSPGHVISHHRPGSGDFLRWLIMAHDR